jgi:ATP-dependent Clp protease protease subunit
MQNFKNVPQYFYGLNSAQMDMFMTEDSPVRRQAEKVTEVSFSLLSLLICAFTGPESGNS